MSLRGQLRDFSPELAALETRCPPLRMKKTHVPTARSVSKSQIDGATLVGYAFRSSSKTLPSIGCADQLGDVVVTLEKADAPSCAAFPGETARLLLFGLLHHFQHLQFLTERVESDHFFKIYTKCQKEQPYRSRPRSQ